MNQALHFILWVRSTYFVLIFSSPPFDNLDMCILENIASRLYPLEWGYCIKQGK